MIRPTLTEMVHELCAPSRQRTTLPDSTIVYRVSAPSLLSQLSSLQPSASEAVRRGFGSRPTANLEAVDHAKLINDEARQWCRSLGLSDNGKPGTVIMRLHGHSPQLDRDTLVDLTIHVRRWWCGARVLSGWDSAPFKPRNRCPVCSTLGSLRIIVSDRIATCVECRSGWDSGTLGVLAQHIRSENGEAA